MSTDTEWWRERLTEEGESQFADALRSALPSKMREILDGLAASLG